MNNAIEPEMIYQLVNQDYTFIDIRDPHQYNQLHIKNFQNIQPHQVIPYVLSLSQLQSIILICYSGKKAKELSYQLNQLGYTSYYIKGGFQAFLNIQNNQYF